MQHRTRQRPRAAITTATAVMTGALGLVVLTAGPAQAAPTATTATIDAPATVTVGDDFDVDVTIPATADVFAYEITLDADEATVAYQDGSVTGPDGGFDSVTRDGDELTIVHTRLGTSPAIGGDLASSIGLTATSVGTVDLAVTSITLLDEDGAATTLDAPAATDITIEAAATTAPTDPATPGTPGGDPTNGAGAGGGTGTGGTVTDADAVSGASRPAAGQLAWTGAEVAPWIAASLALLLAGGGVLVARTRARRNGVTR